MRRQAKAGRLGRDARQIADLDDHRRDARDERLGLLPIRDHDLAVGERDATDAKTRQWVILFRRIRLFAQALDQGGKIVPACPLQGEVEDRRLEGDVGEGPGPVDEAADFKVRLRPLETDHRTAVGFG